MTEAEAKALIRKHGWLTEEAVWVQDAILSRARLRHFGANEYTFHADDDPGGIYGVVSGGFGVLLPTSANDMVVTQVIRLGVWFGHGPVLTGRSRALSFRALEPSTALHLPMSSLGEIKAQHPEFSQRLAALSERNFSIVALRVIADLLIHSTEKRVAATLVRISRPEASEDKLPPWPIHLTQAEIGRMANASRDRVSQALRKFQSLGWIEIDYRAIIVKELEALTKHAEDTQVSK